MSVREDAAADRAAMNAQCLPNERRMIVSLDMKMMNAIKWVDRESMMACIEAGAVGKELEARLGMMGYSPSPSRYPLERRYFHRALSEC